MPTALIASGSVTNINCNNELNGAIDLTVNGGTLPYSFSWSNGHTNEDLSGVGAGNYTVTITDNSGCSLTRNFTITEPLPITVNETIADADCFGAGDGSIDLSVSGGVAPYAYQWSNGETTEDLFNLSGGTYSVTITDGNACVTSLTYVVDEPSEALALAASTTDELCNGDGQGAINLTVTGGTAPYTYQWNTGQNVEDIAGLNQGVYQVTVVDANGCSVSASYTISGPDLLQVSASSENVICNGEADGTIDLTVLGGTAPYTYSWSNGQTTEDINNLSPGNYSITITDANGCESAGTYSISEPLALIANASVGNVSCFGADDGKIDLSVSGGNAPYSFQWSAGSSVNSELFVTEPGRVTLEVSDLRGCFQMNSISVDIPELGLADFTYNAESIDRTGDLASNDPVNFFDQSIGEVFDWHWDFGDGFDSDEIDPIHTYDAPGQYTVVLTVTDRTGCETQMTNILEITEGYRVMFPDAFTPNGDGNNDFYRPQLLGLTKVQLIIYNTWGEVIFNTEDLETKGWDGMVNGLPAENGNYVFKLVGLSFNGLPVERDGIFALIK